MDWDAALVEDGSVWGGGGPDLERGAGHLQSGFRSLPTSPAPWVLPDSLPALGPVGSWPGLGVTRMLMVTKKGPRGTDIEGSFCARHALNASRLPPPPPPNPSRRHLLPGPTADAWVDLSLSPSSTSGWRSL